MDHRNRLLSLYDMLPFHQHPMWQAVLQGNLSPEEIPRAEAQHFVRSRAGRKLRQQAVFQSKSKNEAIFQAMLETYLEECTDKQGPNHLELVRRLVLSLGMSESELESTMPTPGNAAAIALYRAIGERGFACHMLGAGAVEFFYSRLCPSIFNKYTGHYGMSESAAETYRIHGPMDKEHAERPLGILSEALKFHTFEEIELSVRDAFVATTLHYDGMLQAATGKLRYWNGETA